MTLGPRGFRWGVYVTDDEASYALQVDAAYLAMPERGWTPADGLGLDPLPRTWLPRKVRGVDADGHRQEAIVARLDADLWTGVTLEFTVEGSDLVLRTVTVTEYLQEEIRRS